MTIIFFSFVCVCGINSTFGLIPHTSMWKFSLLLFQFAAFHFAFHLHPFIVSDMYHNKKIIGSKKTLSTVALECYFFPSKNSSSAFRVASLIKTNYKADTAKNNKSNFVSTYHTYKTDKPGSKRCSYRLEKVLDFLPQLLEKCSKRS